MKMRRVGWALAACGALLLLALVVHIADGNVKLAVTIEAAKGDATLVGRAIAGRGLVNLAAAIQAVVAIALCAAPLWLRSAARAR
jgi:hypothetical protein